MTPAADLSSTAIQSPAAGETWRVRVGDETTLARFDPGSGGPGRAVCVFAHSAGGRLDDRGTLQAAALLTRLGLSVVRFNFLYRERGSRRPDPMPRLMDTFLSVVGYALTHTGAEALLLGGRSMGGRAASMLAADGFPCGGLVLFAYPLHPAGQPDRLRDAHLSRIDAPVLCLNGTRDELCRRDRMEATLRQLRDSWTMHWLEGADHSFRVLRSSGRTEAQVWEEIRSTLVDWLGRHMGGLATAGPRPG